MALDVMANVKITAAHPDGEVFAEREIKNLVVTAGFEWVKGVIHDDADSEAGVNFMDWTSIGDDNTAPAAGQTDLISAQGSRTAGTYASGATGVCTITGLHVAGGTWGIVEAGLHAETSSGAMLARVIFSVINLSASDELTVEWTITYS